ncbi:AsnC family transcriptional regulator [Nonomuraea basaltis]|uniref:AsnC family transcriptional regulator n=1 Tax=Nonomuraea basaltis TaxID=2495887 RepID=UPI00110C5EF6|nr:AsnC family transcriptional regulator [Nonomuraea basaltis]TMR99176.1 AsnC family transcriptional regulator [Nonomuraea basaltis]
MQDSVRRLGEDDLALIHALQLRPRASWTDLGRALGVDPVTAARRWSRLTECGEAWIGVSPGPRLFEQVCVAFVDIECAAGAAAAVARALSGRPHVLTLERSAGTQDLLATVATSDLAAALDTSSSTVKRRLDRLTRLGLLRFRCDFARPLEGWPVAVTFWAKLPTLDVPDIGHALIRLPETRNCAAISGPHNLILQASLHSVEDVLRFETQLAIAHPSLDIAERVITLRHDKLLGRLLDPYGRSVGTVPPDIWSNPVEATPDPGFGCSKAAHNRSESSRPCQAGRETPRHH